MPVFPGDRLTFAYGLVYGTVCVINRYGIDEDMGLMKVSVGVLASPCSKDNESRRNRQSPVRRRVSVVNLCGIPFCRAFLEIIHCLGQQ